MKSDWKGRIFLKKRLILTGASALLLSFYFDLSSQVSALEIPEVPSDVAAASEGIPINRTKTLFTNNRSLIHINTNKDNLRFYSSDPSIVGIEETSSTGVTIGTYVDMNYGIDVVTGGVGTAVIYALDEENNVDPNSMVMITTTEFSETYLNSAIQPQNVSIEKGSFYSYKSSPGEPSTEWYMVDPEIFEFEDQLVTLINYGTNGPTEYKYYSNRFYPKTTGTTLAYGFQNGEHVKSFNVTVAPAVTFGNETVKQDIPFEIIYKNDATLVKGEEVVETPGTNGLIEDYYDIRFEDGVEVFREKTDSAVVKEAVSQVVLVGTAVPIESIVLDQSELVLDKGTSVDLIATITPEDTTEKIAVKWESSNPSVATVDETGRVTAVDGGNAKLTASVGDKKATATIVVNYKVLYEDYPVGYAWDFGVWSNFENGTKVASSFNDFAGKKLAIVQEKSDKNKQTWVLFQVNGETVGWVNKTGLRSQLPKVDVLYKDFAVSEAWNFGVWTNYENGSKLSGSLNNYRGKELSIIAEAVDSKGNHWVQFQADERTIGWVSQLGLKENKPTITVLYKDRPVSDAWNYGVWDNYQDAKKLPGSLNNFAGKTLSIIEEKSDSTGNDWVKFQVDGATIGWVSSKALVENQLNTPVLYTVKAVSDAWNYGVWDSYQNGKKLPGSLNNYAGKTLSIIGEKTDSNKNSWVQFQVDGKTIGWVSKLGITTGEVKEPDYYYSVLPVSTAWNFGIWSNPTNGKYVTNLNYYAGKFLRVVDEEKVATNNIWAKISLNSKDIGWVSKRALRVANPYVLVLYSGKPVTNAWDYSVWTSYENGKKVGGSLNDYAGKTLNVTEEKTVSGIKWVKFEYQGRTIGWVARAGLK